MVIDVRKLNAQKKYSGTLEWEEEGDETLVDIPYVKFSSPIKVSIKFELYEDDALEIKGKISFDLQGKCSRCLEDAKMTVEGDIQALFEPFENGEDYVYSRGLINTKEAVNDAVMACMPKVLLCKEDCVGIQYK